MGSFEGFKKAKDQLSNFLVPENERIERLRQILEHEQKREISTEEAQEVGDSLLQFFKVLGEKNWSENDNSSTTNGAQSP